MKDKNLLGYLEAFTAVFFWSFNVILASLFVTSLTPMEFAFGRWLIAAVILLPLSYKGLKKNFSYLKSHFVFIVWLALTGIVLDNTLIYVAARTTNAIDMGLLNALGPVFIFILSAIFLKTPVLRNQIIGTVLSLCGVVIIVTKGHPTGILDMDFSTGDLWMILNAFCFAVYSLLQKKRPPEVSQLTLLSASVVVGVVILLPFLLIETPLGQIASLGKEEYSVLIYLGIFNSVIAYLTWNSALAKIGSVKTGIVYYLLPVITMVEAALFLSEKITWAEAMGGFAVLVGIVIVGMKEKPSEAIPIERP